MQNTKFSSWKNARTHEKNFDNEHMLFRNIIEEDKVTNLLANFW